MPPYRGSTENQIKPHVLPIGKRYFDRPLAFVDHQARADDQALFGHAARILYLPPVYQLRPASRSARCAWHRHVKLDPRAVAVVDYSLPRGVQR